MNLNETAGQSDEFIYDGFTTTELSEMSLTIGQIAENQAKFCQGRVTQTEKHLGMFCETMGSITRKTARLRDKGDILCKQLQEYTKSEDVSHSMRGGLKSVSENLSAIQDYRHAQIQRLESKVVRPISDYGNICRQIKASVKNELNAIKKEQKSKQQLQKVRSKAPGDESQIAQSEVERAREDASIGSKHLEEQMMKFERRRLHDLKTSMHDFFQIQLVFHAKALEYYSRCLESVSLIDSDGDLQNFQRRLSTARGPPAQEDINRALHTMTSTNGYSDTMASSTTATSPYSSTYESTTSEPRRVRISNTSMMYGDEDDDDDDYEDEDDDDDDDYDLSSAR